MDYTQKIAHPMGSIVHLRDCVQSYAGLSGGDPRSPVWFCALEWGGGLVNEGQLINVEDFRAEHEDHWYLTGEQTDDYIIGKFGDSKTGRPGGCAFYRSQFGILTALIENLSDYSGLTDSRLAARRYRYFGEHRFGYLLNVSPVSMSGRSNAENEWIYPILKTPESDVPVSLAEWTGIPSYREFFSVCAHLRKPLFTALRKKYTPAVIYCGGLIAFNEFKDLWMDEGTENEPFERELVLNQDYNHCWLDNGLGKTPTLLMVGPFFCNRNGLNGYAKYWSVARLIRNLCNDKFGNEDNWLRLSEFYPRMMK